ncbi:hypothetical protein DL769_000058 [Monosporascus sp. CRB-8-3]|nr:hypothetical protein DL769_000058 [Monosporascus sp. CRB-8-3]
MHGSNRDKELNAMAEALGDQYFILENRLINKKPDSSVNEELGRRFILEAWVHIAIGKVDFDPADNPRLCNSLVIDEGSLRSLVALPDETPSLELVSREERRVGRLSNLLCSLSKHMHGKDWSKFWSHAYIWLVDSPTVRRFQGVNDADNYNGWMKPNPSDLPAAWFERVARFEDEAWIFGRREIPEGSGDLWYFISGESPDGRPARARRRNGCGQELTSDRKRRWRY